MSRSLYTGKLSSGLFHDGKSVRHGPNSLVNIVSKDVFRIVRTLLREIQYLLQQVLSLVAENRQTELNGLMGQISEKEHQLVDILKNNGVDWSDL